MSCHVMSCHVTSRHVMSCHIMSSHVTSRGVALRRVVSFVVSSHTREKSSRSTFYERTAQIHIAYAHTAHNAWTTHFHTTHSDDSSHVLAQCCPKSRASGFLSVHLRFCLNFGCLAKFHALQVQVPSDVWTWLVYSVFSSLSFVSEYQWCLLV